LLYFKSLFNIYTLSNGCSSWGCILFVDYAAIECCHAHASAHTCTPNVIAFARLQIAVYSAPSVCISVHFSGGLPHWRLRKLPLYGRHRIDRELWGMRHHLMALGKNMHLFRQCQMIALISCYRQVKVSDVDSISY